MWPQTAMMRRVSRRVQACGTRDVKGRTFSNQTIAMLRMIRSIAGSVTGNFSCSKDARAGQVPEVDVPSRAVIAAMIRSRSWLTMGTAPASRMTSG